MLEILLAESIWWLYCCNVLSSRTSSSHGAELNNRVLSKADSLHSHIGVRKVLISAVKKKKQEGKKWLWKTWVRLNPGGRTAACSVGEPSPVWGSPPAERPVGLQSAQCWETTSSTGAAQTLTAATQITFSVCHWAIKSMGYFAEWLRSWSL